MSSSGSSSESTPDEINTSSSESSDGGHVERETERVFELNSSSESTAAVNSERSSHGGLSDSAGDSNAAEDGNAFRWFNLKEGKVIESGDSYGNNAVHNTKYSILTFLFYNLRDQFRRLANVYFAFIGVITLTPLSPVQAGPFLTAFAFVLLANAIREAAEDIQRWKADNRVNNAYAEVVREGEIVLVRWAKLRVGDIVRVKRDGEFPADLALISSAFGNGECFVQTSSLDGESSLKRRICRARLLSFKRPRAFRDMTCSVSTGPATADVSDFTARVDFPADSSIYTSESGTTDAFSMNRMPDEVFLGPDQFLARGTQLKNTKWILGLVVYTGQDTKYQMNCTTPPRKRSRIEHRVNRMIIYLIFVVFMLCLLSAFGSYIFETSATRWYLENSGFTFLDFIGSMLTFLVIYGAMVPISLYVSMEFTRLLQATLIYWDEQMRDPDTGLLALPRTSTINEELGQISFILSDKTGTLTRNKMEFRACVVLRSDRRSRSKPLIVGIPTTDETIDALSYVPMARKALTRELLSKRNSKAGVESDRPSMLLWLILALCHTAIVQHDDGDESETRSSFLDSRVSSDDDANTDDAVLEYSGSSPDEVALLDAAAKAGIVFVARTMDGIVLHVTTNDPNDHRAFIRVEVLVLGLLAFTSERKRMSVLVKCPAFWKYDAENDQRTFLLCKGADSAVLSCLAHEPDEMLLSQNERFASAGLRTLALAYREYSDDDLALRMLLGELEKAQLEMSGSSAVRAEVFNSIAIHAERNLRLVGFTGIEDQLQEHVPETLQDLLKANIRVWVLTGDKRETAVSIAKSCKLITRESTTITLRKINYDESLAEVAAIDVENLTQPFVLVIATGEIVNHQVDSIRNGEKKFVDLARLASSVVFCRATPIQKALVVQLLRENDSGRILAIGDGANDVYMIQHAHVGVGVRGREGMQAVFASDYAIGKFHFLRRLLLVHGHWNYWRMSLMVLYFLYKNALISLIPFWWAFFSMFSGQAFYDAFLGLGYSLAFTSLPIIIASATDRTSTEEILLKYPQIYSMLQNDQFFTTWHVVRWLFLALYHSIVVFGVGLISLQVSEVAASDGLVHGSWVFTTAIYWNAVFVAISVLLLELRVWLSFTVGLSLLSIAIFVGFAFSYGASDSTAPRFETTSMLGVMEFLTSNPVFWFQFVLSYILCLLPVISFRYAHGRYNATMLEHAIYHERELRKEEKRSEVQQAEESGN